MNKAGTYVVEELAILGGPADLHDTRSDHRDLIVPNTRVHTECTPHALEWWRVTSCLREVLTVVYILELQEV